jgi:hypothetical protein
MHLAAGNESFGFANGTEDWEMGCPPSGGNALQGTLFKTNKPTELAFHRLLA